MSAPPPRVTGPGATGAAGAAEGRELACVSVVMLSHNRLEDTGRNLRALMAAQPAAGFEVIVVDNASTDGSAALIRGLVEDAAAAGAACSLIASERNLGAAGGRNLGWARAGREFILGIDDDSQVAPAAMAAMAACLRAAPDIGVVFPRIRDRRSGAVITDLGDAPVDTAAFYEACFMLRRSLYERIGGIDERLFFGGEGLDYAIRTRCAGMRVVHLPGVEIVHNALPRDPAASRQRRARWLEGFVTIHHKHFPPLTALGFTLRYTLASMVSGVRACGVAILPALVRAAWAGFRAGRRVHAPAPPEVVRFYRDPRLRPEFGNEPLAFKLRRRIGWRRRARP